MKKLYAFLVAAVGLLLWAAPAHATHFRYGTINWRVPDPGGAPRTVEFTVQQAWRASFIDCTNLNFGDNTPLGNGCNSDVTIGTGVDANGQAYAVREYKVTHTYANNGPFLAFFEDCCRISTLQNGADETFRVETLVNLAGGNTSGPVTGSVPIRQMQVGAVRTEFFPFIDPDGDPVTCRLATDSEVGFPNWVPTLSNGAKPTVATTTGGCNLQWNLATGVPGNQYVIHVVVESVRAGATSSSQVDLIIEFTTPPPPTCAGGGSFNLNVGQAFSKVLTGTNNVVGNLKLGGQNAPAGSTFTPALGTSGASPYATTFNWTPALADAGTVAIVPVTFTNNLNLTGTCYLTLSVLNCPNVGAACTNGVGECKKAGVNICSAPGVTQCNAVAGMPVPETCDNKDNDCNGTVDNAPTDVGVACSSGLPGVCGPGLTICTTGVLSCNATIKPNTQAEICDNKDNDCDGVKDDSPTDVGVACMSGLPGVCGPGLTICTTGTLSCDSTIDPGTQQESCDALDNDCDGSSDENYPLGDMCTVGIGECKATGAHICNGMGGLGCSATPGQPTMELCDGLDNDCDGANDNGDPGGGIACVTGLKGICGQGLTACQMGAIGCVPNAQPGDEQEVCGDALDSDCDGLTDNGCNGDTDGDGLSDADETANGTDPNDADSDDDGVPDGDEPDVFVDTDGDGLINGLDPDSDNDALYDGTELGRGCDGPGTNAMAGHCIADGDDGATTTDPLDSDSDDGGVGDGQEDLDRDGVLDPGETDPTTGNGDDDVNEDTDGDGLTDAFEEAIGSDPLDADSDDDGALDGDEPNPADDTDGDGTINVLDSDSDDDELTDGLELGLDCSDPATDPAANACTADGDQGATTTSPVMPDTDGGSVKDGDEDKDHDGVKDELETDPTAGNGDDDLENDFDGDGIPNEDELLLGTDPLDADSDDDGVKDGAEPSFDEDTDGDGTINALDPDSDNDGLQDGTELGLGCDDEDTDASAGNCVADADDGATKTNPLDADTDDGSVSDGDEDTNKNGAVDDGERDPNVASDDVPSTGCTTDADCGDAASGRVCDTESGACIDGCRGEDGNGCPSDESCSSDDATVGTCEPTSAQAPEFSAEGNGIFCSYAPSNDGGTSFGMFALLAALGLVGQRRSRRRAA